MTKLLSPFPKWVTKIYVGLYDGLSFNAEYFAQYREALSPDTKTRRLSTLFRMFPLEVTSNPNIHPSMMYYIAEQIVIRLQEDLKPEELDARLAFALLWSIEENPALCLLRLEDPGHRVFTSLLQSQSKIRIYLQLALLPQKKLGLALLESLTYFFPLIAHMGAKRYRLWMERISALWRKISDEPVPTHDPMFWDRELPLTDVPPEIYVRLMQLRTALDYARRDDFLTSFQRIFGLGDNHLPLEFYQFVAQAMEAASVGQALPNRAEIELRNTTAFTSPG